MNKLHIKSKIDLKVPRSMAGNAFIPNISSFEEFSVAHTALEYLKTVLDRKTRLDQVINQLTIHGPLISGQDVPLNAYDLAHLCQHEFMLAEEMKLITPEVRDASLHEIGITRKWDEMLAEAADGEDPMKSANLTLLPGDEIVMTQKDRDTTIVSVTRDNDTIDFEVEVGGYSYYLIRAASEDLPEVDLGISL